MEFKFGDRVRMLKHADWKNEAVGTIEISMIEAVCSIGSSWLGRDLRTGTGCDWSQFFFSTPRYKASNRTNS